MDFTGTSGDDTLTGTSGSDLFKVFQGGNDTVSGLGGNDVFNFGATFTAADKIDGGSGNDTVELTGDYSAGVVFGATTMVNVETIRLSAGFSYSLTTNDATVAAGATLTISGTALAAGDTMTIDGSAESDGNLHIRGGAGDDAVAMGAHLTVLDQIDGGSGNDTLTLNGAYNIAFRSATLRNISDLVLLGGHNYHLGTNDATVAAGATMTVDASALGAGDTLFFNGGTESDGNFNFDGTPGLMQITAGAGDDAIFMGADLTQADRLNGGAGSDVVYLAGDYTLALAKTTLQNVENLVLAGGFNYNLTTGGGIATNATLVVDATQLGAGDTLKFDAHKETLGSVIIDAGATSANLTGGQQGDAFDFNSSGEGGLTASDRIDGQAGYDRLYLDGDYTGGHALTLANATVLNVEEFDFSAGFSYNLTLAAATVAAGGSLKVDASALGAADQLTFDGSAASATSVLNIIGGAGNDTLTGGAAANSFDLSHGGNDTATGGDGDDTFIFGAALTAADSVDGGAGNDIIVLDGTYNLTFSATNFTNVETLRLSAGHNYTLTSDDANVAAGANLIVDASALGAGNAVSFNGSEETDGTFAFIGGAGNDTLTAGLHGGTFDLSEGGNDKATGGEFQSTFDMGAALSSGDRIDGGEGSDGVVVLDGDYTGSNAVTVNANVLKDLSRIDFDGGHSYNLTYTSATEPGLGVVLFDASALTSTDSLTLDISAIKSGVASSVFGGAGDDHILGGKNGSISLSAGGNDTADAQGGLIFMGAALTTEDVLTNVGILGLDGNYDTADGTALNLTTATVSGGGKAILEDNYNYDITVSSADVISAVQTNGFGTVTFDGSAETTKSFTYSLNAGGHTTINSGDGADVLTDHGSTLVFHGNGGDDSMELTALFNTADQLDGGAGNDTLTLDIVQTVIFTDANLTSIENIVLPAGGTLTTVDANVAAGQTLKVTVPGLHTLNFNGAAETDGQFDLVNVHEGGNTLVGGAQNDTFNVIGNNTITGGGGGDKILLGATSHSDTLIYHAVSDSTSVTYDTIQQLDFNTDIFQVSPAGQAPSAIDAAVTSGALSTASFDANLAAAIGSGQLASRHAVLFTANAGTLSGHTFLVVDENGATGYQAGGDIVIDVTGFSGTLTTVDFS